MSEPCTLCRGGRTVEHLHVFAYMAAGRFHVGIMGHHRADGDWVMSFPPRPHRSTHRKGADAAAAARVLADELGAVLTIHEGVES